MSGGSGGGQIESVTYYVASTALDPGSITIGTRTPTQAHVSVAPSGGTAPYSYDWHLNSSSVSGANTATPTLNGTKGVTYTLTCTVTDAAAVSATTAQINLTFPRYHLICDGNSIFAGYGQSAGFTTPKQVAADLGPLWEMVNFAQSGQPTSQMLLTESTNIYPLRNNAWDYQFVLPFEIRNDLANAGVNTSTAYNNYATYCTNAKSRGFTVIPITCPPTSTGTAGYETARQTVNALIRTNLSTLGAALVDMGGMGPLGLVTQNTNTIYYGGDAIHLNDLGGKVFAAQIDGVLNSFVNRVVTTNAGGRSNKNPFHVFGR